MGAAAGWQVDGAVGVVADPAFGSEGAGVYAVCGYGAVFGIGATGGRGQQVSDRIGGFG